MSWISEILDLLNLNQVRLLYWFLRSEAKYVESDGLKFEWCDDYVVLSHPRWGKSLTIKKVHVKLLLAFSTIGSANWLIRRPDRGARI